MQITSTDMHHYFISKARTLISAIAVLTLLSACGSSDSNNSEYTFAYLQFYNGSPNGANVEMREVDGDSFGSAQFGDTTSMYSMDDGELELEFIRTDSAVFNNP